LTAKFEFNSQEDKVQFYKAQPGERKQVTVSHDFSILLRDIWKEIKKLPHLYHIPTNLYKSHVCKIIGELKSHYFVVFLFQKHFVLQIFSLSLKESTI